MAFSYDPMYPGQVLSPLGQIEQEIGENDTTIVLTPETVIPASPNILVITRGLESETIRYNEYDPSTHTLSEVERGFQGVAKPWPAGTGVARLYTEYDHRAFINNLNKAKEAIEDGDAQKIKGRSIDTSNIGDGRALAYDLNADTIKYVDIGNILEDPQWLAKGDLVAGKSKGKAIVVPSSGNLNDVLVVDNTQIGGLSWKSLSDLQGVCRDEIWDHQGDLAVGIGINRSAILARGGEGQILKVKTGEIVGLGWADEITLANDPLWGENGRGALVVRAYHSNQNGGGYFYTAVIPAGATDEVLTVDPTKETGVSWKSIQTLLNITDDDTWQAKGDLIIGTEPGKAQILPVADPGKILSIDSDSENPLGLKWITAQEAFSELPIDAVSSDSIWNAKGDVLFANLNDNEVVKGQSLPIGEGRQVLTVSGGVPAWEHINIKTLVDWGNTARGSLAVGINRPYDSNNHTYTSEQRAEILAPGTNGDILTVDDTQACRLAWKHLDAVFSVGADSIWNAAGDLAVGSGENAAKILTIGAEGNVLTVIDGEVRWESPVVTTTLKDDPAWETKGDLVVGKTPGESQILGVGQDGQHLLADSTSPLGIRWSSPDVLASIASDFIWKEKGDLAVGIGEDAAQVLPAGSDGKILCADSESETGLSWKTEIQLANDPLWSGRHNIAVGHRIFRGTTDDGDPIYVNYAERVPIGTKGQVLSVLQRTDASGHAIPDTYGSTLYLGYDYPPGIRDLEERGDILIATGSHAATRLPLSPHPNYVLTVDPASNLGVSWKPFPEVGGIVGDNLWAEKGDLAVALGENSAGILPKGSQGQALCVDNIAECGLAWKSLPTVENDPLFAMKGDLAVGIGEGGSVRLPAYQGYGHVLISNPVDPAGLEWIDPKYIGTVEYDNIWDNKGDIVVGKDVDLGGRLVVGEDGAVLMADSASDLGVKWASLGDITSEVTQNTDDIAALQGRVDVVESDISTIQGEVGDAIKIRGTTIAEVVPTEGQVLKFNATSGQYEPGDAGSGTGLPDGTTGDIPMKGADEWGVLSPGQAGYYLKSQGPGNPLVWATVDGGGGTSGGTGGIVVTREREGDIVKEVFMYHRVPKDGTITSAIASLGALPGGQSVLVDIRKNGTDVLDSIFVADQPIQIATDQAATNGIYQVAGTLDAGRADCVTGDVIFICVLQIGTTNPGQDLQVQVVF